VQKIITIRNKSIGCSHRRWLKLRTAPIGQGREEEEEEEEEAEAEAEEEETGIRRATGKASSEPVFSRPMNTWQRRCIFAE
jgi:hypothetical protein